jgi:membrane protein
MAMQQPRNDNNVSPKGLRPVEPAQESHHGRQAESPSDIPPPGWKDIILRVYQNLGKHRVIALAAGVAFYALLAVFPAVAALVAIYGFLADPATIASHLDSVAGLLPGGAIEVIRDQMTRIASHGRSTLGLTFAFGLGVSLWSANAGMKAIIDALNLVYNEEEKRGFIKLNLVSLTFTLLTIIFVLFSIAAIAVVPVALAYVGLGDVTSTLVKYGRWPILFIMVAAGLAALYRYGPSRCLPKWRWITWGSAFGAVAWMIVSLLFSWYAANFGSYNETYGSLGAVIGFMMWLWLSAIVVLLGAELDAEMEHQTAKDTTTGNSKPMGDRGAYVADTVGAAQT